VSRGGGRVVPIIGREDRLPIVAIDDNGNNNIIITRGRRKFRSFSPCTVLSLSSSAPHVAVISGACRCSCLRRRCAHKAVTDATTRTHTHSSNAYLTHTHALPIKYDNNNNNNDRDRLRYYYYYFL